MLRRNPLFTTTAVLCLGLGIGANATMFTFFYEVLIDPLPFPESRKLVNVYQTAPARQWDITSVAWPDFAAWRDNNHTFAALGALDAQRYALIGRDRPERLEGAAVTRGLLDEVLGIEPIAGRGIRDEDCEVGAPAVAMLGWGIWQRIFGGEDGVIGETITLNGESHTVIGIMPQGFGFPENADVWTAFRPAPGHGWGYHFLDCIGRLGEGFNRDDALEDLAAISAVFAREHPETNEGLGPLLRGTKDDLVGFMREQVLILYGIVCFVLLLACANVANLLLARAAAREREIAIRATLGAGRWRVMRQLLTESVMLSLLGGALGIALGWVGRDLVLRGIPVELPSYLAFTMSPAVIAGLILITGLCGILFGFVPALQAMKIDLNQGLAEGTSRSSGGTRMGWFRSFLVVLEVGLALVVLVAAGLMIKGFMQTRLVHPGFERANVLTVTVEFEDGRYRSGPEPTLFFSSVLDRLRAIPGVEDASVISHLPMGRSNWMQRVYHDTEDPNADARTSAHVRAIMPGYFRVMQIPFRKGRDFAAYDLYADATPVAIVNELFADLYWPGEDPLGRWIRFTREAGADSWFQVVGLVGDVYQRNLNRTPRPCVYRPLQPGVVSGGAFVMRTALEPLAMAAPVRDAIWREDPDLPLLDVHTMEQVVEESNFEVPLYAWLFSIFSVVALVLAAVGVYGVVAYTVSQRTREFGIRLALGAEVADVRRLVLRRGVVLLTIGLLGGLGISWATMQVLESMLFGVNPGDPVVYLAVTGGLAAVTLLASWIPARRATAVDPVEALRAE